MATVDIQQRVEGTDPNAVHSYPDVIHTHDHSHVSHHHRSGIGEALGEFEHRAFWHTHAHNHTALTHGHDYAHDAEDQHHPHEAHIHDHAAPTAAAR